MFLELPLSGTLIVQKNNLKVFRSKKAKGTKQDSQNLLRSARPEGDEPKINYGQLGLREMNLKSTKVS